MSMIDDMRRIQEAQQAVAYAEQALRNSQRKLRMLTHVEEPQTRMITFTLRFKSSSRRYEYVALKINDPNGGPAQWYLTGETVSRTWKQLVDFLTQERVTIIDFPTDVHTGYPIPGFED